MADIKISDMEPWTGAVTGNVEFPAVYANQNFRIALSQLTTSTFGFGSMAMQNSNAVNITGGNVAVTALSGAITIANGGTGLGTTPTNGQLLIGNGTDYTLANLTAGTGISITNSSGAITIAASGSGFGTVTSVGVDGQSTGLTFSNSPITTSGTIVMGGVLNVGYGGTGSTTASGARANLSAAKSGANSDITSLSGLTTPLSVVQGGTGANDSLSGYIYGNGTNAFTSVLTIPVSDLTGTLPIANGGTGATTAAAARVNLLPSYAGNGGKALFVNPGATDVQWQAVSGAGTVTSVDVSGGTTGLTTSGGPIIAAGTITFGGTLITSNGGTGLSSYTAGDMTYYASGTALTKLGIGTSTYILTSSGSAPQWTNPTSVVVGRTTNISGGAAGSIPYQTSANTTALLAAGTGVLIGGSTPSYTMSPSLTQVTVAADPTSALQVATKQYVDTLAIGSIHYHTPVKYEAPAALTATYNQPGGAGVGVNATLTNAGTLAAFAPDGPTASFGDRILIYNQANAFENGIYTVTTVGSGSVAWVLTRATDADTYSPTSNNGLGQGDAFFVQAGNTGAGETYVMNTQGVITFGSTSITFVQVSDTQIYSAGTGLTLSGTQFSITPVGTAGTYGSASQVPVVTTNASGQVSSVTNTSIAIAASQVTSGTFSIAQGGTGQTTASAAFNALSPITAAGDLIIGNGTNSATRLGIGANGYLLTSNGTTAVWTAAPTSMVYPGAGIPNSTGSAWGTSYTTTGSGTVVALATSPAFTTPNLGTPSAATLTNATGLPLTTGVTGTLGVANGGTGATSLTANNVILGNGTSAVQVVAPGTNGNVLTSNGTTWVSSAPAATGVSQAKATVLSMILGF